MNQLSLKKTARDVARRAQERAAAAPRARPGSAVGLGVGAIIGTGIFVLTGVAAHDRTGPALMLSFVVAGVDLHLRRALLRRVRVDGAGRRLGLHLRVRHARRAVRVDHRLGPDPRIRGRLVDGRARLVALLPGLPRLLRRRDCPMVFTNAPFDFDPATGVLVVRPAPGSTCRRSSSPLLVTIILVKGIQESATFNAGDRHAQGGHRAVRDRRRRLSTSIRRTGRRSRRSA